jgi:hypothetical protein
MSIGQSTDVEGGLLFRNAQRGPDSTREMFVCTNANFVAYDINVAESPIRLFPDK